MKVRIHPFSNGEHYGWGKARSLFDFFFPIGKRIRCEATTGNVSQVKGIVIIGERHFFTFRALFWHYAYQYLINPIRYWRETFQRAVEFAPTFATLLIGLAFSKNKYFDLAFIGAIGYDTVTAGQTATGQSSLTYAHTVTGTDPFIMVNTVLGGGGTTISSVTYAAAAMKFSPNSPRAVAGVTNNQSVHFKVASATGNNNVVVTLPGSANIYSGAASYSGVKTFVQDDYKDNASAASLTQGLTTKLANSWVIWGVCAEGYNITAGAGTTWRTTGATGVNIADNNANVASAGTAVTLNGNNATNQATGSIIFEISASEFTKRFQVDTNNTLRENLESCYKADDNFDDFFDSRDGSDTDVSYVDGKINRAGSFNGSSSRSEFSDARLADGIKKRSLDVLFRVPDTTGGRTILGYGTGSGAAYRWWGYRLTYDSGNWKLTIDTAGETASGDSITINANTWYHAAITFDGIIVRFYLNGVAVGTYDFSATINTVLSSGAIGRRQGYADQYFKGNLEEIRVWNKVLSAQEIADLNNGGSGQTMEYETVLKSVSDTGSGADGTPAITSKVSPADSGAGADSVPAIIAKITALESGSGVDALTQLLAQITESESGSGADAISALAAKISVLESGIGADAISLLAEIAISESGSAADAIAILAAIAVSENASAADAIQTIIDIMASDSGAGAEAVSVLARIAVSDSGLASEALAIQAIISVSENGLGAEAIEVLAKMTVSENASGIDVIDILRKIGASDSGAASEALAVLAQVVLADQGFISENPAISAILKILDDGIGAEAATVLADIALSDSGNSADAVTQMEAIIKISEGVLGDDIIEIMKRVFPYLKKASPYGKKNSPYQKLK